MRHTSEVIKRLGFSRRRRFAIAVAGVLVVWLAARAGSALVVRVPLPQPDAVLSLASHEHERLPLAARLATSHPRALVLLTRPPEIKRLNCEDCEHRVERLREMGIDESRVRVLQITEDSTHGEAVTTLAFARDAGIRQLLIVTSPYHTRRALAVFRRVFAGSDITLGIEPAIDSSPARPSRWLLGSYDRSYVVYEWAAVVYYVWKYGLRLEDLRTFALP